MATTQKRSGGSRSSSARSAPAKRMSGTGGSRSRKKPAPKPLRREIGAGVCLLLSICAAFGYFQMDALFINFFCSLAKGLLGYGFWLLCPCLLLSAFILAFHRGRPVRLRLCCALLLPVALGCIIHGFQGNLLPWDKALLSTLWSTGEELKSGGVLGGLLGQTFVALFTSLGSTIISVLAFLLMGLGAFNRSLADVADWIFNRPQYEYEEEPEPRHQPERRQSVEPEPVRPRRKAAIDIPMDDQEGQSQESQPEPEPKKRGFFNRTPRVPSPDQLLMGRKKEEKSAPEPRPEAEKPVEYGPEPPHGPIQPPVRPEPAPEPEPVAPPAPAVVPPRPTVLPEPEPVPVTPAPQPVQVPPPAPMPEQPVSVSAPSEKLTAQESAQMVQQIAQDIQQGVGEEHPYQYPPLSLLDQTAGGIGGDVLAELDANKQRLSDTIHSFGIDANIVNVTRGPSVTRYELELDQGVRLNKLTNLADDIALALGATGVRIAPIPDQISMVGIEVPNKLVSPVNIYEVLSSKNFQDSASKVSFAVGKDIGGNCIVGNIAKLPHLLIAGTTGSGKSVCTNSLIISLLYKATPEEVRLIMVDPKMVELGIYNGIPHLLIPVVTDPKKAAGALQWAVTEMMKRYRSFAEVGVRDLASYNKKAAQTEGMEKMPQIVVIIDELADLMLVAAKEVEESICRVAQMGRASGMHLVIATQRPSADVITGLMKANIPSRIAFAVASAMESRIILDTMGAEKLVGRGDMLFFPLGMGKPTRVQGCFISDQEVASVVEFIKRGSTAQYDDQVLSEIEQHAAEKDKNAKGVGGSAPEDVDNEYDELIDAAAEVVIETGQASVSMLQRRLKLGYARAARLVDQLEEKGIVGPFEGSKPRQLLITKEQWQEMKLRQGGVAAASPQPAAEPVPAMDPPPFDVEDGLDRAEEDTL